jgi:hypothetical protein
MRIESNCIGKRSESWHRRRIEGASKARGTTATAISSSKTKSRRSESSGTVVLSNGAETEREDERNRK